MAKEEIYQTMPKWEQSDEYSRSYAKKTHEIFIAKSKKKSAFHPLLLPLKIFRFPRRLAGNFFNAE